MRFGFGAGPSFFYLPKWKTAGPGFHVTGDIGAQLLPELAIVLDLQGLAFADSSHEFRPLLQGLFGLGAEWY